MASFLLAVFLSAFLLFQIQPIIARFILPAYGGSPAVWTSCMMFFQLGLLLGYYYAHVIATRLPPRQQVILHMALLGLALLFMPIGVSDNWQPDVTGSPAREIFVLLTVSVGVPFVLVSASGPLLQHWFAGAQPGRSPFRLYAVSNLGSLAALLSYPFLIEPEFTILTQALIWSVGYAVLILLFLVCGIAYFKHPVTGHRDDRDMSAAPAVSMGDRILWVALSACGSTLLLATTNQISQNIAVVPFLWILPLSIYLLTFVICFDNDRWYRRDLMLSLAALSYALLIPLICGVFPADWVYIDLEIGLFVFVLFCGCMICHGELARSRSHVKHLTTFYLYVALGGALGGVFVNLLAPAIFSGFWELHIALVAVILLAGICLVRDADWLRTRARKHAFLIAWPLLSISIAVILALQVWGGRDGTVHVSRSFFGVIYVEEWKKGNAFDRTFYHGSIVHGKQYLRPAYQKLAGTYFGKDSGAGLALLRHPNRNNGDPHKRQLNIGAVGLGIGTISTHARRGDRLRYYEINPQVEFVANKYFTYLANGKAETEIVLGDARISMQRELDASGSNQFDVLILDAFSADAIPIHLLTKEAFALYDQHLQEDGIIAIHITTLYLDLKPVALSAADQLGMNFFWIADPGKRWYEYENEWVLLTRNSRFARSKFLLDSRSKLNNPTRTAWTDDFSNLFEVIDWQK